ncbi:APC membrane recruitment protein 1, partial [Haliaeetus albicilla]
AAEPQQPQPPPGKLKKTAFKLFGGKRSICTLPSFFGGRSKGQGKVASKKGLSKCKTHDGLSGAAYDKGDGAQLESPSEGSRDSHPCPLPSSQSAHLAIDTSAKFDFGQQDSSPPGSIEGCEKKPNGEKSSFPRPKKGLKGFFNSIRRHRKSKVAECEKAELPEWTGDSEEASKAPGVAAESRGAAEGRDVTSLKSFDSLTGCGDDIAEPDIAESTISVERSRDAAKRSSCLVTYQGGGEEMAIPEEAEEYLNQIWNGNMAGDRSYGAQVSSSSLETHASHEVEAHPYMGDAMDGVDLLTPQSDQQESAPNSDEGYYDSTTPGPEDEAGDGLSEIKKDRLPRDSYSGDALYEF